MIRKADAKKLAPFCLTRLEAKSRDNRKILRLIARYVLDSATPTTTQALPTMLDKVKTIVKFKACRYLYQINFTIMFTREI